MVQGEQMYHQKNSCNRAITHRHILWCAGCMLSQCPRLHATPSHVRHRQAYRDSSGISPLQARHIKMPPTRARPPATQPTKRAEPKVYLRNTKTWLVNAVPVVQSASSEMHWTLSFSVWHCRSSFEHRPTCRLILNGLSTSFLRCMNREIPDILLGQILSGVDKKETQEIFQVLGPD